MKIERHSINSKETMLYASDQIIHMVGILPCAQLNVKSNDNENQSC
jgi:hypothetical protein